MTANTTVPHRHQTAAALMRMLSMVGLALEGEEVDMTCVEEWARMGMKKEIR